MIKKIDHFLVVVHFIFRVTEMTLICIHTENMHLIFYKEHAGTSLLEKLHNFFVPANFLTQTKV